MRLNYMRSRDEVMIVDSRAPLAIEPYLRALVDTSGSDLHLKAGVVPRIRVDGTLHPLRTGPLSPSDTERMLTQIIRDDLVEEFEQTGEADFALMIDGVGRFRVNAFRQRGDVGLVLRRVAIGAIPLQDLGLPEAVQALSLQPRGLILVTGPTGSGKTTTLAGMVDEINKNRDVHVVTIEDPIEIIHHDKRALINQREVRIDTADFRVAMRAAMRQDPSFSSATSVEVPPMSKVIRSGMPTMRPSSCAATTPVEGPERTVRTGSRAACSNPITPPLDCVRCGAAPTPRSERRPARRWM